MEKEKTLELRNGRYIVKIGYRGNDLTFITGNEQDALTVFATEKPLYIPITMYEETELMFQPQGLIGLSY